MTAKEIITMSKKVFGLDMTSAKAEEIIQKHERLLEMAGGREVVSLEQLLKVEIRKLEIEKKKEGYKEQALGLFFASAMIYKELCPDGEFYFLDHSTAEKLDESMSFFARISNFKDQWAVNRDWLKKKGVHCEEQFVVVFLANLKKRLEAIRERSLLPGSRVFISDPKGTGGDVPATISSISRQGFVVFLGRENAGNYNPMSIVTEKEKMAMPK